MRRYRLELGMGLTFLALLLAFCALVAPGKKLSAEEVNGYITTIEQDLVMPEPDRTEFIARLRAWGEADDGEPVYLADMLH